MTKSKQTHHEYYSTYETCRNRWFDMYEPDELQTEDEHLNIEQAFWTGVEDDD